MYMYMYVYTSISISLSLYIYIYIYIYKDTCSLTPAKGRRRDALGAALQPGLRPHQAAGIIYTYICIYT